MAKLKLIQTKDGWSTKVFLDGIDITQHLKSVALKVEAGVLPTIAKLEVVINEAEIEIEGEILLTEAPECDEIRKYLKGKNG